MTTIQMVVTNAGIAFSVSIAWFTPKSQTRVAAGSGGVQEVAITVKGGYTPDIIVLKAGLPVKARFVRQESTGCSEMVLFPDFNKSVKLPEGEKVVVEFTPENPGEYDFQWQMAMLRGKVVVE